jgi:predicted nucleotidyltransferase
MTTEDTATVGIQDRYLLEISRIVQTALRGTNCRAYLFGSRATRRNRPASDFDIAIEATCEISRHLGVARGKLEESHIPFTVDLMDLNTATETLRRRVQEEGVLLWSI